MSNHGQCPKCGQLAPLVGAGPNAYCIWCEPTQPIVLEGDDSTDFVIVDEKDHKYCTKCGSKKKWIVITARKGQEWLCPKC